MTLVHSHNNSGFFRTKNSPSKKKNHGRLFIRRSKIYHSITNNSPQEQNLLINYRPELRHRRIRQKILNGAGDEKSAPPSSSIEQKRIDFTELEQIFDNAIRNRQLYKEKAQTKEIVLTPSETFHPPLLAESSSPIHHPSPETRLDFSTVEPIEEIKCQPLANLKEHKILSAILFVTFSALFGFLACGFCEI